MSTLDVIIVSYRTPQLLRGILERLTVEREVDRIIVVDNNSDDESPDIVAEDFPCVELIQMDSNVGFAKAVNVALKRVGGGDVLLINPDCMPAPGSIGRLSVFLRAHANCAVVAPLTAHPVRQMGILAAGQQPTLRSLFNHYSGISSRWPHRSWARGWHMRAAHHSDRPRSVEWVSGACMLVRGEVIRQLGGMNEQWFMYAEDMEFCLRVRASGWDIYHLPEARMTHIIGASSSGKINTRWVSVLIDYHRRYFSRSCVDRLLVQAVLFLGLGVRAALAFAFAVLRAEGDKEEAMLEARKNFAWALRALHPVRSGLNHAPSTSWIARRKRRGENLAS